MVDNIDKIVPNDINKFVQDLKDGKDLPQFVKYKKNNLINGVKVKRSAGFYQIQETEDGPIKTRQGSHTIAFATYARALNWLIKEASPEEVQKKLDENFHLEVKIACFFNMGLTNINEKGTSSIQRLGWVFEGVDGDGECQKQLSGLDDLYYKLEKADISSLEIDILNYLNRIVYIYQYLPSATLYKGWAASLKEAWRVRRALDKLDKIYNQDLVFSESMYKNEDVKNEMKKVYDKEANFKLCEKFSIHALPALILQIYRLSYPFGIKKLLAFECSQQGVNDLRNFVMDILSLNKKSIKTQEMVKIALRAIHTGREYCRLREKKSFVSMLTHVRKPLEDAYQAHNIQAVILQDEKITFI